MKDGRIEGDETLRTRGISFEALLKQRFKIITLVETNFKFFIPKTQTFLFRVSAFHKA
jgi:hypothetical protein